jgi:hypothetical protein
MPTPKVIPCHRGFVARRTTSAGHEYLDRGKKWMPSFGGPPETICTKPFASKLMAEAAVLEVAAENTLAKRSRRAVRELNKSIATLQGLVRDMFPKPSEPLEFRAMRRCQ